MSFCYCGHPPGDHLDGIGRCENESEKVCDCPIFEYEGEG